MVKQVTLLCDRCGKKNQVETVSLGMLPRREADLCVSCYRTLIKEYEFKEVLSSGRGQKIIDYDDIPRIK